MNSVVSYFLINGCTFLLLVFPLFFLISPLVVVFLIFILPLTIISLYHYLSLPRSLSSSDQFANITIAHRGGRPLVSSNDTDDFPENTLAAYRWASNMKGADAIELDVWLSRDNIPMVVHDGYLEHTMAECQSFIWEFTCAELKQLKYWKKDKSDVYNQVGSETMPTLEEVVIFLEPTRLKLMIEIKEIHQIPRMASIIHDLFVRFPFLYDRAFCAAFNPYNLYAIRRLNPRITTAYLFVPDLMTHLIQHTNATPRPIPPLLVQNKVVRWMIDSIFMWFSTPLGLQFLGADMACVEQGYISQNLLNKYKKARIVVSAWCVNEPGQRRWLKSNGVTVITDTLFNNDDG